MRQPRGSAGDPKLPRSHRSTPRDWRSLLPDLERMVPWPGGRGEDHTQTQVLENVLGYIQHLQRTLSIVQWGAGHPSDSDTVEVGPSTEATQGQQLVPYQEEEEEEEEKEKEEEEEEEDEMAGGSNPWLGPTGPYWEALGGEEGFPLSPPKQQGGLLGLSPSLLASPPPPGPPDEVIKALFADVYLSPQAPAAAPQEGAADGSPVSSGVALGMAGAPWEQWGWGQGAPPQPKKKCVNGFIMFCRLNRKAYIRAHPGLASTVATRELAQLWRSLSPDERRPYWYCLQARRFSRLHNRMIRPDGDEDSDADSPVPLQLLLATHAGTLEGGPLPP